LSPRLPEGPDHFVDCVMPELQRRSTLRCAYEGKTRREDRGLPRTNIDTFVSGLATGEGA